MKPKQQMQQMTTALQAVTIEFHQQIIFTFAMFKLAPQTFKASDSHPYCHFYPTLDIKEMFLLCSSLSNLIIIIFALKSEYNS